MSFEEWYYGHEGFGLRAERAATEIRPDDHTNLKRWLAAAYDEGTRARDTHPKDGDAKQGSARE